MNRQDYVNKKIPTIRTSDELKDDEIEAFERELVEAKHKGIEAVEKLVAKYATRIRERALTKSGRGRYDKLSKRRK